MGMEAMLMDLVLPGWTGSGNWMLFMLGLLYSAERFLASLGQIILVAIVRVSKSSL